jgi:ABC-type multidrug transport system fused ATPase/permease subunit
MKVRYSFSFLKLTQSIVLGVGAAALILVTWKTATHPTNMGMAAKGVLSTMDSRYSVAGQLVLVQSLFAQLCAPLDHVGQHFRDAVSAAEDLRDLESLKRVLADGNSGSSGNSATAGKERTAGGRGGSKESKESSPLPAKVSRQPGGRELWTDSPPRLEVRNLVFSYPKETPSSPTPVPDDSAENSTENSTENSRESSRENGENGENSKAKVQVSMPILRNISFSIPAGGYSLGIVGPSGSGKSTVLRVLLGLEPIQPSDDCSGSSSSSSSGSSGSSSFPTATASASPSTSPSPSTPTSSGRIIIDGADVTTLDRIPCFAMVGQDTDLFRGLHLADNIRYGTHTVLGAGSATSPEALKALANAAEDAQLAPLLGRVEGGWGASVGPRGRLLSGGERQRVCLARALYREELAGGMLLMDEVTASLDAKTESLVTDAVVSRVRQGATAVLIAHRLSSVQHCDMILVMQDGVIIARGTHAQLVTQGGWYAESWKLQSQTLQVGAVAPIDVVST